MSKKIETWMEMYKLSPSLVLFDDLVGAEYVSQNEAVLGIIREYGESLNPIDVVLESLVNKISEKISSEILTTSKDKVLITLDIRQKAIDKILQFIKKDPRRRLKWLHQNWLAALINFIKVISENGGNLKREEVIFQVGRRFRISSISAIRAISAAIGVS